MSDEKQPRPKWRNVSLFLWLALAAIFAVVATWVAAGLFRINISQ